MMVSIIIPCYNKSKYIKDTILSINNQDYRNWECLIIDDSSTDNSVEVILSLTKDNNRIHLIKNQENRGANYCRNLGASKSKGDFIMFLDADDVLTSSCISSRVFSLSKSEGLDFGIFPVGTFNNIIGDNEFIWNKFNGNHVDRFLYHDLPWLICSVMWKKESFIKTRGFCEKFERMQDVEFHTRFLLEENPKYKTYPFLKPDVFYRINNDRILNVLDFCEKDISAKHMFVNKFSQILRVQNPKKVRFLKGTIFESYNLIFNFHKLGYISFKDLNNLVFNFLENTFACNKHLLSSTIKSLYIYLRIRNVYFSGMNKLFKIFF
tara:strand:+ start:9537 stop:10502 length:966 start_codon:yes stop_codon:yes gene_type:complete